MEFGRSSRNNSFYLEQSDLLAGFSVSPRTYRSHQRKNVLARERNAEDIVALNVCISWV